jgi:hypothetical protein
MKKVFNNLFYLIFILSIFNLIFNINNCSAQWVQKSNGIGFNKNIYAFTSGGNYLFAGTDSNGVFRSTNNGENWIAANNGITSQRILCLNVVEGNIFAGTESGGVFRSTNYGNNWIQVNSGITDNSILTLAVTGTNIYAGTGSFTSGIVFLSTNYGTNWTNIGTFNQGISFLYVNGIYLYAVASIGVSGQYFVSTNNGLNWSSSYNINYNLISSLASNGNNLFAGTPYGVYKTTNSGGNWTLSGLNNIFIYDFALSGSNLFAATWDDTITRGNVYLSTNNGLNWIKKNQGLNVLVVNKLHISNGYIYAGTYKSSVMRRTLSEIIGIKKISEVIPLSYSLKQNFPNPFNPSTNIRYDIPRSGYIRLIVYDALGREVETLVNEKQSAGVYEVTFNGNNLTSGIYIYKLITDEYSETKKMLMIK